MERKDYYRKIPKVDSLLETEEVQRICERYGKGPVVQVIRRKLEALRGMIADHQEEEILKAFDQLLPEILREAAMVVQPPLRKVYNATGILLHTNLGRAPMGKIQAQGALSALEGYTSLEFDLDTGRRGSRQNSCRDLIKKITGAQDALVVNNNAAAVLLMLSTLAKGREVIVSRGEQVEIGGGFRIPQVMEQSGAALREVGTTNRTRISDYEQAVGEHTGALLKVHTSNYKIVGFTQEVSIKELSQLSGKNQVPLLVDLGSGCLINLDKFGLTHEPTVQEVLSQGADVVCFSGDKLLGGPQAGIVAGRKEYIQAMEAHPLMRALRPDKCTLAALGATFWEYLDEKRAIENIPVLKMLNKPLDVLERTAAQLCLKLRVRGFPGTCQSQASISMMGGGSLPAKEIPSFAVTLKPDEMTCQELLDRLRGLTVPLVGYIKEDKVWLDMRTLDEKDLDEILTEMEQAWD